MKTNAKLECTTNYAQFEMHDCNRELRENHVLLESMKTHGFMPSSPIHCIPGKNHKLQIIRGHHRFNYAKQLGLPVYFVVDETNSNIFDLEGSSRQSWGVTDFAVARANNGDKACAAMLEFRERHGLTIGAAAALIGGQSAGSAGNKNKDIKTGKFKIGDLRHAHEVAQIIGVCRNMNIPFAASTAFVRALSMCLRVPEFSASIFCHRIRLYAANLRKRGCVDEYLTEIEELYNYAARGKRIPLKFRAREVNRNRQGLGGRESQR